MEYALFQMRPKRKPKRVRSAFTTEQVSFLEQQFKKSPYISTEYRKLLASILNIQDRAVKIWFQNRRMKGKKESKEDNCIKGDKAEEGQLNNAPLPDNYTQLAYSLKVLPMTADVPIEGNVKGEKTNTNPKTKCNTTPDSLDCCNTTGPFLPNDMYKGALNLKKYPHIYIEHYKKNKLLKNFEAEARKVALNLELLNQCAKTSARLSNDVQTNKAATNTKTSNVKPTYLPVWRSVYNYPMTSSNPGLVWNPMNVVPVASSGPLHHASIYGVKETCSVQKKCSCDCHAVHLPSVFSPGVNNSPFRQYVISMPYHSSRV